MVAVGAVAERLHGPTVVGAKVASGAGRADWESLVGVGWPQPQPGLVGLGVAGTGRGGLHRPFGSGSRCRADKNTHKKAAQLLSWAAFLIAIGAVLEFRFQ